MHPSTRLPEDQATVLRSLYDFRFLRKGKPFPASDDGDARCAPSVPFYQLLAECGTRVDVEAALEILCAKGLAMRARKWCAPSGTWTLADGRVFTASVECRRTADGGYFYEGTATLIGQPFDLGDLRAACFDLTPEGAGLAEALRVPPGSALMPGLVTTSEEQPERPPARWTGDWLSHGEAATIIGYVSRQSGVASGDALRKAIQAAGEGTTLAILKDKTSRCAKHPETGRLRREAVEWVAKERGKAADDTARPQARPKRGKARSEHALNAE